MMLGMHFLVVTDDIFHTILLLILLQVTAQVFPACIFRAMTLEASSLVHLISVK